LTRTLKDVGECRVVPTDVKKLIWEIFSITAKSE